LTEKTLWKLLLKTVLGTLAVFLIYEFDFHSLSIIAGALVFVIIYLRATEERRFFRISFLLLPILALVAIGIINPIGPVSVGLYALFAVLFFVLLGLINLFFKERFLVYGIFNAALFVVFSLLFFYLVRPDNFWLLGPVFFVVSFLILKEVFGFFGLTGNKRTTLQAGVLGFLGVEFAYILQFLPLGFINAAVFLALFLVLGREMLVSRAKGTLNFSSMMKQITIFVVLGIFIFAASRW
jgi:hypothetical protein